MRKSKGLALLCAISLLCGLVGLGGCADHPDSASGDKLQILCTVFPAYDFARQIAGDRAEVTLLLSPGQESHTFEPTAKQMAAIERADLFLYVGGESETWVQKLLQERTAPSLAMLTCVTALTEETVEGMESDDHGDEAAEVDEHVWTSPQNAIQIVAAITDTLCRLSPSDEYAFRAAEDIYTAKLQALDTAFRETVDAAATRTLVFADRFPFRYLADAYGLTYYAPFAGCAHEAEPSAATVAFLIDTVRKQQVPVVLYIEFSNQKIADVLCEATGAQKRLFHSCHNVTADELADGADYLSLMTANLAVLKEALGV